MSLETISIYRDFPVINGYVQVPPCLEKNKTKIKVETAQAAIAGSVITFLSQGSGRQTGAGFGQQQFLRLPANAAGTCCPTNTSDPATTLIAS